MSDRAEVTVQHPDFRILLFLELRPLSHHLDSSIFPGGVLTGKVHRYIMLYLFCPCPKLLLSNQSSTYLGHLPWALRPYQKTSVNYHVSFCFSLLSPHWSTSGADLGQAARSPKALRTSPHSLLLVNLGPAELASLWHLTQLFQYHFLPPPNSSSVYPPLTLCIYYLKALVTSLSTKDTSIPYSRFHIQGLRSGV